jgi:hypothetical protein
MVFLETRVAVPAAWRPGLGPDWLFGVRAVVARKGDVDGTLTDQRPRVVAHTPWSGVIMGTAAKAVVPSRITRAETARALMGGRLGFIAHLAWVGERGSQPPSRRVGPVGV